MNWHFRGLTCFLNLYLVNHMKIRYKWKLVLIIFSVSFQISRCRYNQGVDLYLITGSILPVGVHSKASGEARLRSPSPRAYMLLTMAHKKIVSNCARIICLIIMTGLNWCCHQGLWPTVRWSVQKSRNCLKYRNGTTVSNFEDCVTQ